MRAAYVCIAAAVLLPAWVLHAQGPPKFAPAGPVGLHELDFAPPGPEARRELAVKREADFEFAAVPTVTRAGDRIDIFFETRAFCDATVAIERENGRIVRHLASGVLGENAPEPFQKNSKKQHVIWDGKDDFGVFLDDKDALTVRVSLGLKAAFEKNLHCHPMQAMGPHPICHAGPEGVFIYTDGVNRAWQYLQQFDHAGRYVRTLYPFAADALGRIKGLDWVYAWPEDRKIPAKSFNLHGSLLPFNSTLYDPQPLVGDFTVNDGWITLLGRPRSVRLGTDGTTRGQELAGAPVLLSTIKHVVRKSFARRSAASPDGRWIYLTRAYGSRGGDGSDQIASVMDHAVYRMPADLSAEPAVFLGDPHEKGGDNEHFSTPSGIAVDPQGRIYVSDWDNDRVQVFSPEGKLLRTLPVVGAADITINRRTGEIYVFGWLLRYKVYGYAAWMPRMWRRGEDQDGDYNLRGSPLRVRKFTALDDGARLVYEQNLKYNGKELVWDAAHAPWTHGEIDAWAPQPTLWIDLPAGQYSDKTHLEVWKEQDNVLTFQFDFDQECQKAGVLTGNRYQGHPAPLQRQFLYFDPTRQVLYVGEPNMLEMKYFSELLAIDIPSGRERLVKLPFEAADAAFDARGRIYLLNDDIVGRFDPDTWAEVPFDYGEHYGRSGKIVAVARTIGGHYSSYKHQSLGVSPQGDVIVAGYKPPKDLDRRQNTPLSQGQIPWRPVVYPGRPADNVCVNVFNSYGELIHEDVLSGVGVVTGGLDMDWQDNLYAAVTAARVLDGRPIKYNTGTLAKFGPAGGRFIAAGGGMAPLDKQPAGPAPVLADGGGGRWIEGAKWLYGGTPIGLIWLNCACRQARFKTDYFARSFVPESWRYTVAVLDTAGNVMLRIGQYGNVDSSGPQSLVPLGGDEIGLVDPMFLALDTDRRVFIGDMANGRIVSALLGYHVERRIALREVRDDANQ